MNETEFLFSPIGFLVLSFGFIAAIVIVRRPVHGLVMALAAAVAVEYATLNWPLMAASAAIFLLMLALAVLPEKSKTLPGQGVRARTPVDGMFVALGVLGVIYLIVGLSRGNAPRYALGDFYHVIFEMVLPFFLCTIFLKSSDRIERFTSFMSWAMLILCGVLLLLYVTGQIQHLAGGGMWYRRTEFWRLRLSHNFPLTPLLFLLPLWILDPQSRRGKTAGLASLALMVILVLTLKRTAWIAAVFILLFYMRVAGTSARLRMVGGAGGLAVVGLIAAAVLLPEEDFQAVDIERHSQAVLQRFSSDESDVDSSLGNRQTELTTALEIGVRNPFGHGLGSEFVVERLAGRAHERRHYIHNSYIHYLLQAGLGYVILIGLISIRTVVKGFSLLRRLPDGNLKGTVLGALGCYLGILISSMTELSIHTLFAPFCVALIYMTEWAGKREGVLPDGRRGQAGAPVGERSGLAPLV